MPERSPSTVVLLTPHPAGGPGPVRSLSVEVHWSAAARSLSLSYRLDADLSSLRLPAATRPQRADGLWRRTCFEAFIRPSAGSGYLEFNVSPSGEWAAYRFEARREGMQPLELARDPAPSLTRPPDGLCLSVDLHLPAPLHAPLQLGLAAVVEAADGRISYWALRHGPGPPDFHDPESFTLRLGADTTDGPA